MWPRPPRSVTTGRKQKKAAVVYVVRILNMFRGNAEVLGRVSPVVSGEAPFFALYVITRSFMPQRGAMGSEELLCHRGGIMIMS